MGVVGVTFARAFDSARPRLARAGAEIVVDLNGWARLRLRPVGSAELDTGLSAG